MKNPRAFLDNGSPFSREMSFKLVCCCDKAIRRKKPGSFSFLDTYYNARRVHSQTQTLVSAPLLVSLHRNSTFTDPRTFAQILYLSFLHKENGPYSMGTLLLDESSVVKSVRSSSCISGGRAATGNGLARPNANGLRPPRLRIAKFRSLDGNRGVFFRISISSITDSPSSQTIFEALA